MLYDSVGFILHLIDHRCRSSGVVDYNWFAVHGGLQAKAKTKFKQEVVVMMKFNGDEARCGPIDALQTYSWWPTGW
jgi:hypothetical protein